MHAELPQERPIKQALSLAIVAAGLLICFAILDSITLLGGLVRLSGLGQFGSGAHDADIINVADLIRGLSALVQLLLFLVLIPVYCVWVHASAVNARRLGAAGFAITPGWAVGWYFIPFAHLYMPYKAMSEIWRASAARTPEEDPLGWTDRPVGVLLPTWWLVWVFGTVTGNMASRLSRSPDANVETIGSWMILPGALLQSSAAILCAVVVLRLTNRQQRAAAPNPSTDEPLNPFSREATLGR